jgi:hypothetical protein
MPVACFTKSVFLDSLCKTKRSALFALYFSSCFFMDISWTSYKIKLFRMGFSLSWKDLKPSYEKK